MNRNNNFLILNNLLISKNNYITLKEYPKIQWLIYTTVIYYKQKHKYFLFITIILLLLFFNFNIKTRFLYKNNLVNILQIKLRNNTSIIKFLNNFVYIYFPLIDSFTAETKCIFQNNSIKFCFFKFPMLLELNTFFNSLEHLNVFLNSYKFQLEFYLKKQKNKMKNYNLLHYFKLPILISK